MRSIRKLKMQLALTGSQQFRLFLQQELVDRIRDNPRYSLRSFARFLGVDPSLLSKILRAKRPISRKLLVGLVAKLGLSPTAGEKYFEENPEENENSGPNPYRQLSLDQFHLIAEWYHYPILELIRIKDFQPNIRWIAKRLGISVSEANVAIERLIRLGLLKVDNKGGWKYAEENPTTVGKNTTSGALKKLQKEVLSKAIRAIEDFPLEVRDQTTMTMAIDSRLLPQARERIKKFRRDMCRFLQKKRDCDQVYNLSVSFYPLTTPEGGKQ